MSVAGTADAIIWRLPRSAPISGTSALEGGNGERQNEGEMADLGNHGPAPLPSCQTPFSFSLSATSFGM